MRVVVAVADVPNKNNRIYPREQLAGAIAEANFTTYGTIGMDTVDWAGVDLEQVSHIVENLRFEGNELVGDLRVLTTPRGKVLTELMKHIEIDFRLAGLGNIKPVGDTYEVVDFKMHSINAVENGA